MKKSLKTKERINFKQAVKHLVKENRKMKSILNTICEAGENLDRKLVEIQIQKELKSDDNSKVSIDATGKLNGLN